jgi:hypothetical protein
MSKYRTSLLQSLALLLLGTFSVFAQNGTFSDPNVDYSFDIPDAKWKMTVKPSATSPNVEYVFIDRNDGHLEVRKLTTQKGSLMSDIIRAEELKLQFQPGYVAGKEENFRGKLTGTVFNYEYIKSGRPMAGRFYFLRVNDTTIYLLRFTAYRDKLRSIRNQTDSIGRTFGVK